MEVEAHNKLIAHAHACLYCICSYDDILGPMLACPKHEAAGRPFLLSPPRPPLRKLSTPLARG
jgi:hypothetical protein